MKQQILALAAGKRLPFTGEHKEVMTNDILEVPKLVINFRGIIETEPGISWKTCDIRLPNHAEDVSHIAIDIGGSLAKVIYFAQDPNKGGGTLHFTHFESSKIHEWVRFLKMLIKNYQNDRNICKISIMATGGGAFKYYDLLEQELNVKILRENEMDCLITGFEFFIREIPGECFISSDDVEIISQNHVAQYPMLLVNIGSGVSILKITAASEFERIGGSSLGGGTLWGLISHITGLKSFDEMLQLSKAGDHRNVDMLVGDIYGQNEELQRFGLKQTAIASTFGKVFKNSQQTFKQEDISASLLLAISNNIGQIAYLHAERHNIPNIYFAGSFIRGHLETIRTLSYAIRYWSKGKKKAYFLRHDGYLGASGAFLRHEPPELKARYKT